MDKRNRFPEGDSSSDESGSSGRIDTEISASENCSAPRKKWIMLNPATKDGFGVPVKVLPLSKLSHPDRQKLLLCLKTELEKVGFLRKKVETRNVGVVSVSPSTSILSGSNAQNVLKNGNTKRSSALTDAPAKKLKPGSLTRGTSGRFQSSNKPSEPSSMNSTLMRQCENLLKKLMSHEFGWVFNSPVDPVKLNLPDYFDVIKNPMDLGTVKKKISSSVYTSPLDFVADVRLAFTNAMTYNPPANDVHLMAATLSKFFEVRWKVIEKKLSANVPQQMPQISSVPTEAGKVKPMPPSKKRKHSSTQLLVLPEPVCEPVKCMTAEEKQKLSKELESSLSDLPDNIIEFLREQSSAGKDEGEDEIEIDIDTLTDDTLFKLQKLLDDHLTEKRKHGKGEPCEIELLNESGVSNSSMQLDKGNGLVAKDVDLVGNEPPVSSYPPTEIIHDSGSRSNKFISPGTSSDSDSRSFPAMAADVATASSSPVKRSKDDTVHVAELDENAGPGDLVDGNQSVSGLDQLEPSQQKPSSVESDSCQDGTHMVKDYLRVAILKKRFADTILKAQEKTLKQGEKVDPERLRLEREMLESQKRKEKARLQAEAKAAENAMRLAEAEAAAESKRQRELEREAARQALLKMEKTVEINGTSRFLEDLEMLRTVPSEQVPSSVDEASPDESLDCFKFEGSNPLEQLGLYMKVDDEDEEIEPPSNDVDVEEGEID
ncbi:transcription factor GTE8 isoform X2 [Daucus carota subsp. sativus]|uniref:transcription factor GTE8 isoform X2 n=1 Tax=Daucus carota subsp. sativus TaxID=79200 RepID=UPI0007EF6964|nr:PREDICTED: transcription factor GTE8-like isoform X2 [Daucus carota subsp. sativus]